MIIGSMFESYASSINHDYFVKPGGEPISRAEFDVIFERERQMLEEGWSAEYDDQYILDELARAAAIYATPPISRIHWDGEPAPATWPWDPKWWKPTDRRRDLVKAGALILAEIERLDRAAARAIETGPEGA